MSGAASARLRDAVDWELPCGNVIPDTGESRDVRRHQTCVGTPRNVSERCGGQDSNLGTSAGRDPKSRAVSGLGYRRKFRKDPVRKKEIPAGMSRVRPDD